MPTFQDFQAGFSTSVNGYEAHGEAGLYDRALTPHRSPRATPREVVSKILYLQQNYHIGPSRIADYLRRLHGLPVAPSSVHRIFGRHGMGRPPANQKHRPHTTRWKRHEKAARPPASNEREVPRTHPGHREAV